MAEELTMVDLGMKRVTNQAFVDKAEELDRPLKTWSVEPVSLVTIGLDEGGSAVVTDRSDIADLDQIKLAKGQSVCLDFGDHHVGHVTVRLHATGSPQDAPAFLRFKFAEIPQEILDDSSTYSGWISKGWIQEEFVHVDVLPETLALPRRYAFRYLEITAIDTSPKFQVVIDSAELVAESAVSLDDVEPLPDLPEDLQRIDRASLKTLQDCMQHVFEDGPKRDRRLWIGDLRLQAKADYATFGDTDLVKRCLYLFAGQTREDGKVSSCVFTDPELVADDTFLWEYSLFFVSVLHDFWNETADEETVRELWPTAYRQIELSAGDLVDGILPDDGSIMPFIDWKEGLEKQAPAHGVWIYVLRQGKVLAERFGTAEQAGTISALLDDALEKAMSCFWDPELGYFVSGDSRQVSKISQAWMVLADVVDAERGRDIMLRVMDDDEALGVLTPYAYHHLVEALLHVGEKDRALELMRSYWGAMIDAGADTFWEAFDPDDPLASPYGNMQVNSFCHAWSCTPAWLLREYFC